MNGFRLAREHQCVWARVIVIGKHIAELSLAIATAQIFIFATRKDHIIYQLVLLLDDLDLTLTYRLLFPNHILQTLQF